jgi:hypothetical protein
MIFKELIIIVTSTVQRYKFFLYFQIFFLEIVERGPFVMECELRVYGQGRGEFERITRIYFVRN